MTMRESFNDSFLTKLDLDSLIKRETKLVVGEEKDEISQIRMVLESDMVSQMEIDEENHLGIDLGNYQEVRLSQMVSQRDQDEDCLTQDDMVKVYEKGGEEKIVEEMRMEALKSLNMAKEDALRSNENSGEDHELDLTSVELNKKLESVLFNVEESSDEDEIKAAKVQKKESPKMKKILQRGSNQKPKDVPERKARLERDEIEDVYVERQTKQSERDRKRKESKEKSKIRKEKRKRAQEEPTSFRKKRRLAMDTLFAAQEEFEQEIATRIDKSLLNMQEKIRNQIAQDFHELRAELNNPGPDNPDNTEELENLQQQYEEYQVRMSERIKALENERDSFKNTCEQKILAAEKMITKTQFLESQIAGLKSDLETSTATMKKHTKEKNQIMERHRIEISSFEKKIQLAEASYNNLKNSYSAIEQEKSQLENTLRDTQSSLKEEKRAREALFNELKQYNSMPSLEEIQISEEKRKELQEVKNILTEELKKKSQELEDTLKQHKLDLDDKDNMIKKLGRALTEIHGQMQKSKANRQKSEQKTGPPNNSTN